jgi:hypothetical protein
MGSLTAAKMLGPMAMASPGMFFIGGIGLSFGGIFAFNNANY